MSTTRVMSRVVQVVCAVAFTLAVVHPPVAGAVRRRLPTSCTAVLVETLDDWADAIATNAQPQTQRPAFHRVKRVSTRTYCSCRYRSGAETVTVTVTSVSSKWRDASDIYPNDSYLEIGRDGHYRIDVDGYRYVRETATMRFYVQIVTSQRETLSLITAQQRLSEQVSQ
jgi:hypothetical protein